MSHPSLVRYSGLAGSSLLAWGAWKHGARSPYEPTITPAGIFAGKYGVLLPLSWLVGITLLVGAWWFGRRAVPSLRWAYVTAGLWIVPFLPVLPMGSYDTYSYACQGFAQAVGQDPYGAGPNALGCPWVDAVSPVWRDSPAPYGPVFVVLGALAVKLGGTLTGTVAALRVIALLGVALTAVCLPPLARRCGVEPKQAVWLALACPLVAIHQVSGTHNDAVMVGLIVAGLAAVAVLRDHALGRPDPTGDGLATFAVGDHDEPSAPTRSTVAGGRPWIAGLAGAGVLFGLAVGIKATAVVVLPFAVLAVVPPRSPIRDLIRPAAALGAGAIAAVALVSVPAGLGFGWVTNLAGSGISVHPTSAPTAVGITVDLVLRPLGVTGSAVPVTRIIGIVALAAVLTWLWWRARAGHALLGAGLALAATVVLSPVFHPWYATWPLAALAAMLHRDTKWLVVPCAVASVLCLTDGDNLARLVRAPGAVAMTALLAYLGVQAYRRTRPARDRVAA